MAIRLFILLAWLLAVAGCGPKRPDDVARGKQHYTSLCAACHGPDARGDGTAASALPERPADLTLLSRRNDGVFPATAVMAKVWGTDDVSHRTIMPGFADRLVSDPVVQFDSGDGILTPTPARLVDLTT